VAAKQPDFVASGGAQSLSADALYFDGAGEAFEIWMLQTLGDYLDADKAVFIVLEPDNDGSYSFFGIPMAPNGGGGYFAFTNATDCYDRTLKFTRLNNLTLSHVAKTGAQMFGIWSEDGGNYNITSGSGEEDCITADTSTADWTTAYNKWGKYFSQIGGAIRDPAEQTGQRFTGWIYEMLIWDGALTSADRTALHAYATTKYGSLPPT